MQGPRRCVSTEIYRADLVARRDEVASGQIRPKRFESGHVPTRMLDGEERTIDDGAAKSDDPVGGRSHDSGSWRQIDSTMTGAELMGRCSVRGYDFSNPVDRPGPPRVR